jgi:hypothetical protein
MVAAWDETERLIRGRGEDLASAVALLISRVRLKQRDITERPPSSPNEPRRSPSSMRTLASRMLPA